MGWVAAAFLALLFVGAKVVHGEEVKQGTGIVCDTARQIEAYAVLAHNGSPEEAIDVVNGVAEPVCAVLTVAFIRGKAVQTVPVPQGRAAITEITIVGYLLPYGWAAAPPEVQYTLFLVQEEGA